MTTLPQIEEPSTPSTMPPEPSNTDPPAVGTLPPDVEPEAPTEDTEDIEDIEDVEPAVELEPAVEELLQGEELPEEAFNEAGEITKEVFAALLNEVENLEPEQVIEVVDAILETNLSQEQAIELVVSAAVLEAISEDQAEQIFEELVPAELTATQAEAITEAMNEAPSKVKKTFESIINIFGSQFEAYISLGSNIPVSQRRSLVAIGGLLTMLPPPPVRIKT